MFNLTDLHQEHLDLAEIWQNYCCVGQITIMSFVESGWDDNSFGSEL
jgi:hypothetical protein